jgi:iron complex transport system substrate-binding protein
LWQVSKIAYASSCTVVDGLKQTITLNKPAQRIISLAPNITEILFSIGAGNQVVGVVTGCDYPLAARKVRCIGSKRQLDFKQIKAMHPDLIITWKDTYPSQRMGLEKLNIPIYTTNPRQIEDIPMMMKNLGCLAGRVKTALEVANHFSSALEKIRKQHEHKKPLTVFFQVGAYSLVTINKHSWINQLITVCGGRNVFAEMEMDTPDVDLASIAIANPEVIIDVKGQFSKEHWKTLNDLPAVKNNRLFTIDPDLIERPGPRLLEGVKKICKLLQTARAQKNAIIV